MIGSSVEVAIERWRPLLPMDTMIRSLLPREMVLHCGVVILQCRELLVPSARLLWVQQNRCVYYSTQVIESTSNCPFYYIVLLLYAIHQPPYLASLLHFSNIDRQLRSTTSQQLSIPRTKLNLGKCAFSVAAPIIWNELLTTI